MAKVDQGFEAFRCDLVAYLSARFGLAPDVVASHLRAWLLDREHPDGDWRRAVTPLRAQR